MKTGRILEIDIRSEIDRRFDDSSLPPLGQPEAVVFMGGVASGKTTLRQQDYSRGYVTIDAAELFHHLSRDLGMLDFPDALLQPLQMIGPLIARRAISQRRNIVTEILGTDPASTQALIGALGQAGYRVKVIAVACSLEEQLRRNENRGDNISAYHAEPFHRQWIINACTPPHPTAATA